MISGHVERADKHEHDCSNALRKIIIKLNGTQSRELVGNGQLRNITERKDG